MVKSELVVLCVNLACVLIEIPKNQFRVIFQTWNNFLIRYIFSLVRALEIYTAIEAEMFVADKFLVGAFQITKS